MKKQFFDLVEALVNAGYELIVSLDGEEEQYYSCTGSNRYVELAFCVSNKYSYRVLDGRIAADHKQCFDKWPKAPLNLPLPSNNKEILYLLLQLEFVGSQEGYKLSNNYNYLDNPWPSEYPIPKECYGKDDKYKDSINSDKSL